MAFILRPPSSRDSLLESLHALGRSRRSVSAAAWILLLIGVELALLLLITLADASWGLAPLTRALGLCLMLTLAVIAWQARIRPALQQRTDPLATALALEDRYPQFHDALGSAVSFLADSPEAVGASRFRQAAVNRAARLAERYDFRILIPFRRFWAAFWLSFFLAACTLALALIFPTSAPIALHRLADPYGAPDWPTKTRITILQAPTRLALGQPLVIEFQVDGVIPELASLHIRRHGAEAPSELIQSIPLGHDSEETSLFTATVEGLKSVGSYAFQVSAHDGTSAWHEVMVVPPPQLVPREGRPSPQIEVAFPAYTRLGSAELADGSSRIDVPLGSHLTLRAAYDRPLEQARLVFLGDRTAIRRAAPLVAVGLTHPLAALGTHLLAEGMDADVPLTLNPQEQTLHATFRPVMSGLYGLKMTDLTGLEGQRLLEIRLLPDPAPHVTLARPNPSADPHLLTPQGTITVEVQAEDRIFAIRRLFLEYRFGPEEPYQELVLDDGPGREFASQALAGGVIDWLHPRPVSGAWQGQVPLARFVRPDGSAPRAGDVLLLRAAADDWDDVLPRKAPGQSSEIELRLADRPTIDALVQKDLADFRRALLQLRSQQREAQTLLERATPLPGSAASSPGEDQLLAAEHLQRQIGAKVRDTRDGLSVQADRLQSIAVANDLSPHPTRHRVETLARELQQLKTHTLPQIESLLQQARQSASKGDAITSALREQETALKTLDALLDHLEEWGTAGEIAGEARTLRNLVQQQFDRQGELSRSIPEVVPTRLDPAQVQELDRSARKLEQSAEQIRNLLSRASRRAEELELKAQGDKPTASPSGDGVNAERLQAEARTLREAIRTASGQALADDLREAAQATRDNQLGRSREMLQRIAERLESLSSRLQDPGGVGSIAGGASSGEATAAAEASRQDADRLDALAEAQDLLRKKARAALAQPPANSHQALQALAAEQQRLIDSAQEILHRLQRRGSSATSPLMAALDRMKAAEKDLAQGRLPADADDAIDRLEEGRDQLDQDAGRQGRELARQSRRRWTEQLRSLRDKQQAAIAEADRLAEESQRQKRWPRPLQASLNDLAQREQALAEDVQRFSPQISENHPVIEYVLRETSEALAQAAQTINDRLDDIVTAPAADFDLEVERLAAERIRQPMQMALRRLDQLLQALREQDDRPSSSLTHGPDSATPQADPPAEDPVVPPMAQLKMLRALQVEVNQRTAAFAQAHPDPARLTEAQRAELQGLERAQRAIAALFEQFAQSLPSQREMP